MDQSAFEYEKIIKYIDVVITGGSYGRNTHT